MAIGCYFIIISPRAFVDGIFGIFGLGKLSLYGPNVMQLFESYYYVAGWYPAAISAITLLTALVLYYFYTKTLKPLVAVLPAMIFFLREGTYRYTAFIHTRGNSSILC